MKTLDTKELIYNEHTSNRPLTGFLVALFGGLIIAFLVIGAGLGCLAIAYYLVVYNPDMETVIWSSLALFSAGVGQWLWCFLTSKK